MRFSFKFASSALVICSLLTVLVTLTAVGQSAEIDEPCMSVVATKMNILYRGVVNPVQINLSGIPDDVQIVPSVSDGRIWQDSNAGKGAFLVEIFSQVSSIDINVNVRIERNVKRVGSVNFRVIGLPAGQSNYNPFESENTGNLSAIVSPIKMNVLYRGVKNPISISVPGVSAGLVKASITGGTLTPDGRENGVYIAEVYGGSEAIVHVSAETNGAVRSVGKFSFRVKDVPPPIATIAGIEEGLVSQDRLSAAPTVIPKMKNFDFELFFKVTKFDLVFQVGTDLITKQILGSSIPPNDLDQINRLKHGARVYVENITAIMLDENNRPASGVTPIRLSPLSLKIR